MIIVTGHLLVAPEEREAYLATCTEVVRLGRAADGCLDFALSADLLDPGRIDVAERWRDEASLDTFRGSGPSGDQHTAILGGEVTQYETQAEGRPLLG